MRLNSGARRDVYEVRLPRRVRSHPHPCPGPPGSPARNTNPVDVVSQLVSADLGKDVCDALCQVIAYFCAWQEIETGSVLRHSLPDQPDIGFPCRARGSLRSEFAWS